jgi:hypothetical protein
LKNISPMPIHKSSLHIAWTWRMELSIQASRKAECNTGSELKYGQMDRTTRDTSRMVF